MKRLALAVGGIAAAILVIVLLVIIGSRGENPPGRFADTDCPTQGYVVLEAQAVTSARQVPCVADTLEGWALASEHYETGVARLVYRTGTDAGAEWIIELRATCTPDARATPDPEDERHYERTGIDLHEGDIAVHAQWYEFAGGCVTSRVEIPDRYDEQRIFDELDAAFTLVDRAEVDRYVAARSGGDFGLDPR